MRPIRLHVCMADGRGGHEYHARWINPDYIVQIWQTGEGLAAIQLSSGYGHTYRESVAEVLERILEATRER